MTASRPPAPASRRPTVVLGLLALALALLAAIDLSVGSTGFWSPGDTVQGLAATLGWGPDLGARQVVFELRLGRVLTALGVGAALAYAGVLLQGIFRNDLAAPGVIGVSSGAALGASLAIFALGGYAGASALEHLGAIAPLAVSAAAFVGAFVSAGVIAVFSSLHGRLSVPTLLLLGIAVNATWGGVLTLLQAIALTDYDLVSALLTWSFGTLTDRLPTQVSVLWGGLALAVLVAPRLAWPLDLLQSGEEDAAALGVDVARVKWWGLAAATLAASVAVAVAGQIGFVGLVAPHLVRQFVGRAHRVTIPACLLAGPVLLLGADLLRWVLPTAQGLPPGVVTSLIGGPFFFYLLWRNRREVSTW
ncbi:MAG: iron ABC transporter permease [Planctomycetota bacterium]